MCLDIGETVEESVDEALARHVHSCTLWDGGVPCEFMAHTSARVRWFGVGKIAQTGQDLVASGTWHLQGWFFQRRWWQ